ncbi:MAG TPA: hypothetical protein PLV72_02355 [Candidatus Magasanikbacteria bacterium]|nr:hypothetical protein [Candidatus Magasanikbacteria bacterium]
METRDALRKFMFGFAVNFYPTHSRPHLDEMLARWLMKKFGVMYPGADIATFRIIRDRRTFTKSIMDYVREGLFPLGIGEGPTDEHGAIGGRSESSTCQKVFELLFGGQSDTPELAGLRRLVRKTTAKDNGKDGYSPEPHFGVAIDYLWQKYEAEPEVVFAWFARAIDALWEKGIPEEAICLDLAVAKEAIVSVSGEDTAAGWWQTYQDVVEDFKKAMKATTSAVDEKAIIQVVNWPNITGFVRIGMMETDDLLAARVMDKRFSCDVRIVRRSSGNIAILMGGSREGLGDLRPLYDALVAHGESDRWSFQFGTMILNGSQSDPDITPTSLSLEEVYYLLVRTFSLEVVGQAKKRQMPRPKPKQPPKGASALGGAE